MPSLTNSFLVRGSVRNIAASLCLLGFASPAGLHSQNASPSTIRAQSQLVVLDVVVTDPSGHPVSDLGRDAFRIFENGVEQKIRNFERSRSVKDRPPTSSIDRSGRKIWPDSPLSIIVVDEMDTPFEETAYSREQVAKYLQAQPGTLRQPTSLLWLNDDGLRQGSDFTTDREVLMTCLSTHKATLPSKLARGAGVEELSASLSAIQQIALSSRGNTGRKQIIWIGRSFPGVDATMFSQKQRDLLREAIASTTNLLLQSRTVIYVIDPSTNVVEHDQVLSGVDAPGLVTPYAPDDPFANSFSFFHYVADTGGKYFYGRNDIHNEIEESLERTRSYYTLSYVPSSRIQDGVYRKVDIRMSDPKLVVQAKSGYYSPEPSKSQTANTVLRFDLREALLSHMTYTGVGVRLRHCESTTDLSKTICQIDIDNKTLSDSVRTQGEHRTTVVAAGSALNANGEIVGNKVYTFQLRLPDHPTSPSYTTVPVGFAIPANTKAVRLAVQDESGRIGTVDVPPSQLRDLLENKR